ncbi:unnamed protein product [Amaranthus hypochondriacus]
MPSHRDDTHESSRLPDGHGLPNTSHLLPSNVSNIVDEVNQNRFGLNTITYASNVTEEVVANPNLCTEEDKGKVKRTKFPSTKLRGYVTNTVRTFRPSSPSSSSTPFKSSGNPYHIAHFVTCDCFSVEHRKFLAAITSGVEPKSFKEAMKDPS